MKVKVNIKTLFKVLQSLNKVVPKVCAIESYKNVGIKCEDDVMELTVSDGRIDVVRKIPCEVSDFYDFSLRMKDLYSIVSKNKKREVLNIDVFDTAVQLTIDQEENPKFKLYIKDFEFLDRDRDEYSEFAQIKFFNFLDIVDTGIISSVQSGGVGDYNVVHLVRDKEGLSVMSCNGFMASRSTDSSLKGKGAFSLNNTHLLHVKGQIESLVELGQLSLHCGEDIKIHLSKTQKKAKFFNEDFCVYLNIDDKEMPEYYHLFEDWTTMRENSFVETSISSFLDALSSISFLSDDNGGNIVLTPEDTGVVLQTFSSSMGEASYKIEAPVVEGLDTFALKSNHLKSALETLGQSSSLSIYIKEAGNPVYVVGSQKSVKVTHLLSPVVL